MPEPKTGKPDWRTRAETWAALTAAFALAAAISFALGAVFAGAAFAALAVTFATITILAARLERQHLEYRAEIAERAARTAEASQRRFLSIANHDLSQPLHAVTLYLAALKKRVEGEEAQGILAKADRSAQALAAMLGSLGEFSRLNVAAETPHIETFALQDVLDRLAAAAAIDLPAPTSWRVRTDPDLLEQALRCLAANAAAHGGGGHIELSEDDDEIEIIVADHGPGVAAEDQARIFDPFVRLGGARSEGLGLGLATARRIADALGLRLILRSAPGEGVRVSLYAPSAS